jgi:hypothetical protein
MKKKNGVKKFLGTKKLLRVKKVYLGVTKAFLKLCGKKLLVFKQKYITYWLKGLFCGCRPPAHCRSSCTPNILQNPS